MEWFSVKGKSSLFCFTQIIDKKFYIEIVCKHLPKVKKMFDKYWRWQQDNDPKHTSKFAKAFLLENVSELMNWPSNSSDLNPIENLWCIVKNNVEKCMPYNLQELERYIKEECNKISNSVLVSLVESIRQRCELVIENNGERISF
ncbi:31860_t:CDS:1 [Racocetra persica]|uniref:31860_t:CDS:1 n=1 Tax=Racocetra persica TaxID=160502 RepID=A0ACA9MXF0_9GLOM|nr:31860_t:CDS:1 [Racocetra persica]